jgi:hypothetical protein
VTQRGALAETLPLSPSNVYGQHKLEAEARVDYGEVLASLDDEQFAIFRSLADELRAMANAIANRGAAAIVSPPTPTVH